MIRDQGSGISVPPRHCEERSDAAIRTPSDRLCEKAYGKLNLTLEVLGKRDDGYHDLRMVMCSVALHDELSIELGTGEESCQSEEPATKNLPTGREEILRCAQNDRSGKTSVPEGKDNLAFRAAQAYFAASGVDPGGFSIRIEKRIPMQAGMAGGSSDAAAVLRALNRRFGAFSDNELRALGLTLGSDVPYCLFGGVALAEGRGERLTRLPALPEDLCFVLLRPDFSVQTPALFRALDAARESDGGRTPPTAATEKGDASRNESAGPFVQMQKALTAGDVRAIGAALYNDFTPVLTQTHSVVAEAGRLLLQHGACGAELTGTGSVLFGVFDDRETAKAAAAAIRTQTGWLTAVTAPADAP